MRSTAQVICAAVLGLAGLTNARDNDSSLDPTKCAVGQANAQIPQARN